MKTNYKILISFILVLFILLPNIVEASAVNMNLEPTPTNEQANTISNIISSPVPTISNSGTPTSVVTYTDDENFLNIENILSIVIIVLGVLLVLLGIAILVRFK